MKDSEKRKEKKRREEKKEKKATAGHRDTASPVRQVIPGLSTHIGVFAVN